MRISDWSSDVCSSDLPDSREKSVYESLPAMIAAGLLRWSLGALRVPELPGVDGGELGVSRRAIVPSLTEGRGQQAGMIVDPSHEDAHVIRRPGSREDSEQA